MNKIVDMFLVTNPEKWTENTINPWVVYTTKNGFEAIRTFDKQHRVFYHYMIIIRSGKEGIEIIYENEY